MGQKHSVRYEARPNDNRKTLSLRFSNPVSYPDTRDPRGRETYPNRRGNSRHKTHPDNNSRLSERPRLAEDDARRQRRRPDERQRYQERDVWVTGPWHDNSETSRGLRIPRVVLRSKDERHIDVTVISDQHSHRAPPGGRDFDGVRPKGKEKFLVMKPKRDRWFEKRSLQENYKQKRHLADERHHVNKETERPSESRTLGAEPTRNVRDLPVTHSHFAPGHNTGFDRPMYGELSQKCDIRPGIFDSVSVNYARSGNNWEPEPDYDIDDTEWYTNRFPDSEFSYKVMFTLLWRRATTHCSVFLFLRLN